MRAQARHGTGFTLFEVMAAVLVLGLIYTVLAQSAIEGVRSEGVSRRRMEASLLVDERLHDIEVAIQNGIAPPIGEQPEEEVDEFLVRVSVAPFDVAQYFGEDIEIAAGARGLFDTSGNAPLRLVDVRVAWLEVDREFEVRRSTFAYDAAALAELSGASTSSTGADAGGQVPDDINVEQMIQMLEGAGGDQR